jgi:excisionase family DNA binding protein
MVYRKIETAPAGSEAVCRGYRISEAAEYMGVSPWFVELKIRSKELRALKMCRHYTILKDDMDAFLEDKGLSW